MEIGQAAQEAVEWACEQDLLDGFVREQKENIIGMCSVEVARNLLAMNILTPEQIAQAEGLPLEQVLELQKELAQ